MNINTNDTQDILDGSTDLTEIYPAQDYKDGKLWYAFRNSKGIHIVNSAKEIKTLNQLDKSKYITRSIPKIFNLDTETVRRFRDNAPDYNTPVKQESSSVKIIAPDLYSEIKRYFEKYVYFQDPSVHKILALWIMHTYVFTIFKFTPYIHIQGERATGKSHLLEVMKEIAFNGIKTDSITPSALYRVVEMNRPTLFIDEAERFRTRYDEFSKELKQLLNAGFKYDAKAQRTTMLENGNYDISEFSAYNPKVLAGISDIDDVLRERVIPIRMLRLKKDQKINRFKITSELEAEINILRRGLYHFGLFHARQLYNIYNDKELEGLLPSNLSSRENDIWEPIFTIGKLVEDEAKKKGNNLQLVSVLKQQAIISSKERRQYDLEQNDTVKVTLMLDEIFHKNLIQPIEDNEKGKYYRRDDLYITFKSKFRDSFPYVDTPTKFVQLLRKTINLKRDKKLTMTGSEKLFLISEEDIQNFKDRYVPDDID